MRLTRPRVLIVIFSLFAVVLLGAGCGSSNDNNTTTSGSKAAPTTATPGINVAKDPKIAAAGSEVDFIDRDADRRGRRDVSA